MKNKDIAWSIIGLYAKNPFDLLSINEIAGRLGKKYPFVHKRTKELIRSGNLIMIVVGRSNLCGLNLDNAFTRHILAFAELCKVESKEGLLADDDFDCHIVIRSGKDTYAVCRDKKDRPRNKGMRHISEGDLLKMLLNDECNIYSSHRILKGIECYIDLISRHRDELKKAYNPIVRRLL